MYPSRLDVNTAAPGDIRPSRDLRWLLVTDVDDTLLGDDAAFAGLVAATEPDSCVSVVLSSSRPLPSLRRTMRELDTRWQPAGMIGALGTEIELAGETATGWTRRFEWFDRSPIDAVMAFLGCEPHRMEFQTSLKASFAVPDELKAEARGLITETGIPVTIIESGDTDFDVIPDGAGKGPALRWVASELRVPVERTIAAGDSLNDADMLLSVRAIVVGNAAADLRELLTGSDAYFATSRYAAGVLEGLCHFGVPLHMEN